MKFKHKNRNQRNDFFRLLRSTFLLFFFICLTGCGKQQVESKRNSISESKKNVVVISNDIGVIRPSSKHKLQFEIPNELGKALTVKALRATCACTVADVNKKTVGPGEKLLVEVEYSAPDRAGKDKRLIFVKFEEDDAPEFALQLVATLKKQVQFFPEEISIPSLRKGGEEFQVLKIENRSEFNWRNVRVGELPKWLSVTNPKSKTLSEYQEVSFEVHVEGDHLKGNQASHIVVFLAEINESEEVEIGRLPISVVSMPPVLAEPPSLFFPKAFAGELKKQRVVFQFNNKIQQDELRNVSFESEEIRLETQEIFAQKDGKLECTFSLTFPEKAPGFFSDKIDVISGKVVLLEFPVKYRIVRK